MLKAGKLLCWKMSARFGLVYSGSLSHDSSLSKCPDLRLIYEGEREPEAIMLCLGPWYKNDNYVLCLLGEQKILAEEHLLEELK